MQQVQTKSEIASTLRAAGLRPKKRLGQHFLVDGNLMRRLVESADLAPTDFVLEVGGGTGGLTDLLASRVSDLVVVERDRNLADILRDRFRENAGVVVVEGDVLAGKHRLMAEVARRVEVRPPGQRLKLVANLPYQVATPLLMNLLIDFPAITTLVFTVQAEVGERITATPGGRAYGPVSILVQLLSTTRQIARLGPDVFWPRPAVDSLMLRVDAAGSPFADRRDLPRFARFVREVFDHRRKTLRSALRYVLDDAGVAAVCQRFDGSCRPETFDPDEWVRMFKAPAPPG